VIENAIYCYEHGPNIRHDSHSLAAQVARIMVLMEPRSGKRYVVFGCLKCKGWHIKEKT